MKPHFTPTIIAALLFSAMNAHAADDIQDQDLDTVQVNASRTQTQRFDKSVITQKDIERTPINNDLSEIIRTQPGVNFTSGNGGGAYGNKRQIDIRSMGPENTLILVDGKPVTSRNSVRYGRGGARNSRGDANWVPPEEVESIEVIRGTAANRYGSGAMGGVVNIKTKPVADTLKGSVYGYYNQPEDGRWGNTRRAGFSLSSPIIKDVLGFKLYGDISKTRSDDFGVNTNTDGSITGAGREGVRDKDIAGRLALKVNENNSIYFDAKYTRQGNIYTGESEFGGEPDQTLGNRGLETQRLYRQAYSLTHDGKWDWGNAKTYIQFDKTVNSRFPEGLGFSGEGGLTGETSYTDSILKNWRIANETVIPFQWGADHRLTVGGDWNHSKLDDASSMNYAFSGGRYMNLGTIPWLGSGTRSGKTSQVEFGLFAEDAIRFGHGTTVTPSLRFDHHSKSGSNWSPALNISQELGDKLTLHAGIARAYKAPNLYQSTENYVLANRQNNCPLAGLPLSEVGSCYTIGNPNLKPETSVNKEIGFDFKDQGYQFGLTYFHNKYRNKIEADDTVIGEIDNPSYRRVAQFGGTIANGPYITTTHIYQWDNVARATVAGFEGYVHLPLIRDRLEWHTNFSYFQKSLNHRTGNPLNVSPKYSISSTLTYMPSESWDFAATHTFYGKQFSRSHAERYMELNSAGQSRVVPERLGAYGIFGLSAGYKWKGLNVRMGVSNLFDKQLYKGTNEAATYNEPGRSYYTSLKYNF